MKEDIIEIEVLEDGTISLTSKGSISPTNHINADSMFSYIEKLAGGETTRRTQDKGHHHGHSHDHNKKHVKH